LTGGIAAGAAVQDDQDSDLSRLVGASICNWQHRRDGDSKGGGQPSDEVGFDRGPEEALYSPTVPPQKFTTKRELPDSASPMVSHCT
jgi:hypothetical protein